MNNVYYVGSGELTFDLIERIINENLKLELAPEAKLRIQKCRDYLDKKIAESEEPLYGITTGFGSLCSKSISSDELGTLQENLIKSHACSVGEEIRPVIIKLMMLLKAHALSLGHSGVQVITVQRILDFFNNDVMPIVYDRGSLGWLLWPTSSCRLSVWAMSIIKERSARLSVCSTSSVGNR